MNYSGIYKIKNKINGKFYIGSAANIKRRWRQHKHELRSNKHANEYLQNAWNKYWEISFEFEIIELCEKENLIAREQYWIDNSNCHNRDVGYNLSPTAANITGYKHTEQSKILMRKSLGTKRTKQHSINIGLGHRKLDLWPCPDGHKCKCTDCKSKRTKYSNDWKKAKRLSERLRKYNHEGEFSHEQI